MESELHPHRWIPHCEESSIWFAASPGAAPTLPAPRGRSLRGVFLAHNGDFDEYDLFGQRVSNGFIGRWLERVLHCENSCVGDSPKVPGLPTHTVRSNSSLDIFLQVAGMLDLLVTKGNWSASVSHLPPLRVLFNIPPELRATFFFVQNSQNYFVHLVL